MILWRTVLLRIDSVVSEQLATVKRIVKRHIDVQEIKRLSKTIRNVLNGSAGNHLELVFNGWEVNYPDIKFIFDVSGKEYFCTVYHTYSASKSLRLFTSS